MRTPDPRSLPHGSLGNRDIHFPTPQGGTPPFFPPLGSDATTPTSVCRSLHALKIWAIESRDIPATFQPHGQFHKNGSTPRHSVRKEPMPGARSPPHPIISAPPFSGEPWVRIPERPLARAVPRHQHQCLGLYFWIPAQSAVGLRDRSAFPPLSPRPSFSKGTQEHTSQLSDFWEEPRRR